jgi:hypothetical protein
MSVVPEYNESHRRRQTSSVLRIFLKVTNKQSESKVTPKAVPQLRLPTDTARFEPRSGHVEFVVYKVALEQLFSEYFGFPCQFSFYRLLHTHLSSGAGRVGQLVADVPSGLSLTPPKEAMKK